jgi:hypothetical protein
MATINAYNTALWTSLAIMGFLRGSRGDARRRRVPRSMPVLRTQPGSRDGNTPQLGNTEKQGADNPALLVKEQQTAHLGYIRGFTVVTRKDGRRLRQIRSSSVDRLVP